ncbi:hypothetical protein FQN54_005063 [Arachnomyces sp. PD_36]|nr:hypothetical protein FQN54_005063 [Arachnomyces sp. PD_36]
MSFTQDDSEPLSPQSAPAMAPANEAAAKPATNFTGNTAELFENLSLDPKSQSSGKRPPPRRPENVPPRPSTNGKMAPSGDRPPREERPRKPRGSQPELDIFADSNPKPRERSGPRRPRRNSESSVMDRTSKSLDPEEERRRRERRHRERESRHRDRDGKSRSKKPSRRLDAIDKLDVTSIYGSGLFHHDGPFDACNPHRNRKGLRTAPMQAFPKDSRNMALGGAGPNNSGLDLNLFHGRTTEGYTDYSSTAAVDPARKGSQGQNFNPTSKIDPVHGDESMGLGTSTFLEGAPASRSAIQRRQSETEPPNFSHGPNTGLQRKKSLAQKIRGINSRSNSGGRMTSPEPAPGYLPAPGSPENSSGSKRVNNDRNPFFQDYNDAYDKKGAKIQLTDEPDTISDQPGRSRAASSPRRVAGLERRITNEMSGGEDAKMGTSGPSGFMSRVKSLRKPRPDRRATNE